MDSVRVRWAGKRKFLAWDEPGHSVVMDAKPEAKGEGAGMRPLEAFLAALAGCTAMDVISVLEKKRQDVRDFEITIEGTQREDEFPHIYSDIHIRFSVSGFGVTEAAVRRAIELSEEKYCSVKGMLGSQTTVRTSFEVLEVASPENA